MTKTAVIRRTSAVRPQDSGNPAFKSAVTNGRRLFVVPPGDNAWSRRFRDILDQIIADLGGPEGLSEGQRQLARRAATISIMCEKLEGEAAAGADIDLECYGQLSDRLGRAFNRLGIRRQQRDLGVIDPLEYAKQFDEAAE
jgi:hypothetical protein